MNMSIWKARIDSALSGIGRDLDRMAREARQILEGLDSTERIVLLGLMLIGILFLMLHYFRGRGEAEDGVGQFVGVLFMLTALAAGAGWTVAGYTA